MKGILRSTFGTLVVAAFLGLTPPIYAKGGNGGHRGPGGHGGYHVRHGGNISWMSARGGHKVSRSGPKFGRGKSVAYRARASRSRCKCAWSWSAPKGVGLRSNTGNYPERCPTLTRNAVYEIRNASATDSRGPVRICNETTS